MIKVISTEAQMVRDLKLVFQGSVKDTKTMHDVHDYQFDGSRKSKSWTFCNLW